MILATKITKLRKQLGWSQEELADKLGVSRQSVSKWESTNSIPELNKIIAIADLFGVSTDYLLRDEIEAEAPAGENVSTSSNQVNLEQANDYVEKKIDAARNIIKGVALSICAVIPLFLLISITKQPDAILGTETAVGLGVVTLLVLIAVAVGFFIKANEHEATFAAIENDRFELAYGVFSVYEQRLNMLKPSYQKKVFAGIALIICSVIPLLLMATLSGGEQHILLTLTLMFPLIAIGVGLLISANVQRDAVKLIMAEGDLDAGKTLQTRQSEKVGAVYWPLVTAIYLGWSFWTMNWGITWIIWPVSAVFFAAVVGLAAYFADRKRA